MREISASASEAVHPAIKVKLLTSFFAVPAYDIVGLVSGLRLVLRHHTLYGDVIFEAGEMLKPIVAEGKVFGRNLDSEHLELFSQAVMMHDGWCDIARRACVAWVLIAKRMRVSKDVRGIIARMVWEARSEASGRFAEEEKNGGLL